MLARHALPALVVLAATACGSTSVEEERVEDPSFVAEDGSYRLELPVGWLRSGQSLTRDGWERQTIAFNAGAVLDPASGIVADPSAPEFLQAMQEELAAQPGVRVLECSAATLDGLPGFRMRFTREEPADAAGTAPPRRETLICGALEGDTLYAFSFEALAADFARDLATFERMLASFERLDGAPPGP